MQVDITESSTIVLIIEHWFGLTLTDAADAVFMKIAARQNI